MCHLHLRQDFSLGGSWRLRQFRDVGPSILSDYIPVACHYVISMIVAPLIGSPLFGEIEAFFAGAFHGGGFVQS